MIGIERADLHFAETVVKCLDRYGDKFFSPKEMETLADATAEKVALTLCMKEAVLKALDLTNDPAAFAQVEVGFDDMRPIVRLLGACGEKLGERKIEYGFVYTDSNTIAYVDVK